MLIIYITHSKQAILHKRQTVLLTQHEIDNDSKKAQRKQSGKQEVTGHLGNKVHGDPIIATDVFMSTARRA